MKFETIKLPYAHDALAPIISEQTIEYHYGKHLAAYINNMNKLIEGTRYDKMSLDEIVKTSNGAIFNNAAQTWNHIFYFESFMPKGQGKPKGELMKKIEEKWITFEQFKEEFVNKGVGQFGSGWVWLIKNANGDLEIVSTPNAETPLTHEDATPLLTFDVWEHAYYLDYQNRRPDALVALWDIVNWDVIEERYNM